MDSFPFFKSDPSELRGEMTGLRREEMKNELVFLTELSRFLNKKAPMLLQEFAESKKIFTVKKQLGMIELETELRRKMLFNTNRPTRSIIEVINLIALIGLISK